MSFIFFFVSGLNPKRDIIVSVSVMFVRFLCDSYRVGDDVFLQVA